MLSRSIPTSRRRTGGSPPLEEGPGRRENARVLGSIEVEAARVVAASQTKRLERHFHKLGIGGVRKIDGVSPLLGVRIPVKRKEGLRRESVSAASRAPVESVPSGQRGSVLPKRVHRHDGEGRERDEGDGNDTPSGRRGRVADPEPRERERAGSGDALVSAALEPDPLEAEESDQKQVSRPEKAEHVAHDGGERPSK